MQLKAFVPVSVRSSEQEGALGNQVTGVIARLPVGVADAGDRLSLIGEQMRGVKESGQAVGASALTSLGTGFAQGNLLSLGARLTASRQRVANLVVTNVPGPQFELRMGKHELLDMFPMVPLGGNLRLGVAILRYNGKISFGLVGDFDAMPDLEALADDFTAALEELEEAAGIDCRRRRQEDARGAGGQGADVVGRVRLVASASVVPRRATARSFRTRLPGGAPAFRPSGRLPSRAMRLRWLGRRRRSRRRIVTPRRTPRFGPAFAWAPGERSVTGKWHAIGNGP